MLSTTQLDLLRTACRGREDLARCDHELVRHYHQFLETQRFHWTVHLRLQRRLGAGGQGVVYLTELRAADGFTVPVALKIFTPEPYADARAYDEAMTRIARVAARVALIRHDNLLDVQNFLDQERIRMMVMEWIDGFDLRQLLRHETLLRVREQVSSKRWDYINNVIATRGPEQTRFKPGVAVAIVHQCLGALATLHRENIVHGDIKPSNVMLTRTGSAKIIDIGSAFRLDELPAQRSYTPAYAAPEVLDRHHVTPRSDLCSLGYLLLEILSGRQPFGGLTADRDLQEAKRLLPQRLPALLPHEVTVNELLMSFCRGLIAPDPTLRFPDAEAATLAKDGSAAFLRQLVKGDMASEYENEIRLLIEELKDLEELDREQGTH